MTEKRAHADLARAGHRTPVEGIPVLQGGEDVNKLSKELK